MKIYLSLAALLLLFACSNSTKNELKPIQISEFKPIEVQTLWQIGGETDEEFQFASGNLSFAFVDDATFILGDGEQVSLKLVSTKGNFVSTIGSKGRGPGELLGFYSIGVKGDTLYVYDPNQVKFVLYNVRTGAHLLDLLVPQPEVRGHSWQLYLTTETDYYGLISRNYFSRDASSESKDKSTTLARYTMGSERIIELNSFANPEYFVTRTANSVTAYGIPFSADSEFAYDARLKRLYSVWTSKFSIAAFDLNQLSESALDTVLHIQLPILPEKLTKERIQTQVAKYSEGYQEVVRKMTLPEQVPVINKLLVDDQSRLWVRAYEKDEANEMNLYWVFDQSGKLLNKLALPSKYTIEAFRGKKALLRHKDENDFILISYATLIW